MCAECHSTNLRKGYDPETADLRHHLVGDRRQLRGLPRAGLAPRRLGRDPADGPARAAPTPAWSCRTARHRAGRGWSSCAPRATRAAPSSATTTTPARELLDHMLPSLLARGALPRRRPDPRRGLRLRLVPAEQDVRARRQLPRLPRHPQPEAAAARATSSACSATSARSTTPPTTTSTRRSTRASRATARCASSATWSSSPTW